jgi:hypothetical protein
MDDRIPFAEHGSASRHRRVLRALTKALASSLLIGAIVATVLILHFDGTLRDFLDRQSVGGMIAVVLVVNAIGFGLVYLLAVVWKQVKRELWPHQDEP